MKILKYLLIAAAFLSCSKKETADNLPIKPDTMASIIYDMQKAKAVAAITQDSTINDKQLLEELGKGILKKYDINQSTFDSCWQFYLANPQQMEILLKKIETTKK
jgi:hypothetical protein